MVPSLKKKKADYSGFFKTENSEYKCLFIWGFRRKSFRAQPPGSPDAISVHSLWGRIGWQRNCINLVPVKMLKTKGFVSLQIISYNHSSLALGQQPKYLDAWGSHGEGCPQEVLCAFDWSQLVQNISFCSNQHCRWRHGHCLCELDKTLVGVVH